MSLMLTSFARQGVRAGAAPPAFVSASLTRYDNASGTAIFKGVIPFPPTGPNAVADAGGLANKRVRVNGSEPAGGIWIEALKGTHANGNLKAAYVEFSASCGSSETVSCLVENATRSVSDRVALDYAANRNTFAWLQEPTLFFVTDEDYRVSCRVAPLPLVTMTTVQANCPSAWHASLTTEFDSRYTASVTSATQYEVEYAMACRAEMTGDPADARRAFSQFTNRFYREYTPSVDVYTPELNAGDDVGSGPALNPEWKFAGGIHLMMYYHTGHKQFEYNMELLAAYGSPVQWASGYGVRNNLRKFMGSHLVGRLMGTTRSITSTPGGWSYDPTSQTPSQSLDGYVDRAETEAATLTVANGVPAWAEGYALYGLSATAWAAGENPTFQIGVAPWTLMLGYLNIAADARIPAALDDMRDFLDTQLFAFTNDSGLATWRHAYQPIDPTTQTLTNAGQIFLSTMFSSVYAYAYARDNNDTAAAAKADSFIDERIFDKDQTDESAPGGGGMIPTQKTVGEWVQMLPHSAAWRAGVPWNGWEAAP